MSEYPQQHLTIHVDRPSSRRMSWTWIVVISLILLLCVYMVYKSLSKRWGNYRRNKDIRTAVQKPYGNASILVLMHNYRDSVNAAKTIFDCFERADSPLRITVAVRQEITPEDTDAWQIYDNIKTRHRAGNFQDQIKMLNLYASQSGGFLHALSELYESSVRGEEYVLLVHPGSSLCDGWDTRLLREHEDARRQLSAGEQPVLSHVPELRRSRFHVLEDKKQHPVMRNLMEIGRATTRASAPANDKRSFFTRLSNQYRVPHVEPRQYPHAIQRPQPITLMSSRFAFLPTALLHRVLSTRDIPELPLYAVDYLLSSYLYDEGGAFFAPSGTLCWGTPGKWALDYRPNTWRHDKHPFRNKVSDAYAQYVGATPDQVSGRALLGLQPDERHGVVKYGSVTELERAKRPFV